jgi:hypothetical protein
LARQGSLYILLVLAVAFASFALPVLGGGGLSAELMSPLEISKKLAREKADAVAAFEAKRTSVRDYPAAVVKAQLSRAQAEHSEVTARLSQKEGWFASVRPTAILERKKLEFREAALRGEIGLLQAAGERHAIDAELRGVMSPTASAVAAAGRTCEAANQAVRSFNLLSPLDRSVRNVLNAEAERLTKQAADRCAEFSRQAKLRNDALRRVAELREKLAQADQAYATAGADAHRLLTQMRVDAVSRTLREILLKAAILLVGIIATPYLIRLAFYFILAPLAERRPAVRLRQAPDAMAPVALPGPSATSAPVTLQAGEELLVRQGYLQSTSSVGRKSTRALLDWRHPLSSLASGLVFLTCIEGEGETTTVSAIQDPFSEVTVLTLPVGAACVLQPRALAAVVQPAGQPLRITSHWRLGSLHAWLTLQLRYLVFHGPGRVVIKGARGVRVERAERGRVFGQDQLVGFSPDLAYSVTRTETFWPYFLGMAQLLRDRIEAGDGVLVLEEAPMAGRAGAHPRKGLEGAFDVMLKAVGL